MEPLISPVFREALAARRDALNVRVRRARAGGARIDPRALLHHVRERMGPAVEAAAARAPDRVAAVVDGLFEVSVDTFARGLGGADGLRPEVDAAWRALPAAATALCAAPGRVARDVIDGALRVERDVPGAGAPWCAELARMGEFATSPEALRSLGLVLAWTCGLAHARDAALSALRALEDGPALAVFFPRGATPSSRDDVRRDLDARWRRPGAREPARLALVARVGGARVLGGPFGAPPRVAVAGDRIYATDGAGWWRLHADAFGATLRRASEPAGAVPRTEPFSLHRGGLVRRGGWRCESPLLAEPSSAAATADTCALTTRRSHRVRVLAVVGGAP